MTIACCGAVGIFPSTLPGRLPTFVKVGVELLVLRDDRYLANSAMLGRVSSQIAPEDRPDPSPDHAPGGAFLHVPPAVAGRRSVRLDRCEATRRATRLGLICLRRRRVGHTAPRLTGRTA